MWKMKKNVKKVIGIVAWVISTLIAIAFAIIIIKLAFFT